MTPALLLGMTALLSHASMEPLSPGGHPFRVYWPERAPTGIVVFLHGVSLAPLEEEGPGMEALARSAGARGYVAIIPIGHPLCDFTPKDIEHCWNLDSIDDEIGELRRIISEVQRLAGVRIAERQIIGFSNGGYLVAGALQRGLLAGFTRVGIIAAGPVGDARPPPSSRAQRVFIEVGSDDRWQRSSTRDLYTMLAGDEVRFREVPGGHVFDGDRAAQFLAWFWSEAG